MAVTVRIPTSLRQLAGGAAAVTAEGATVGGVLDDMERQHPGFKERLFDEARHAAPVRQHLRRR